MKVVKLPAIRCYEGRIKERPIRTKAIDRFIVYEYGALFNLAGEE